MIVSRCIISQNIEVQASRRQNFGSSLGHFQKMVGPNLLHPTPKKLLQITTQSELWGFHTCKDLYFGLLGCNSVCICEPAFLKITVFVLKRNDGNYEGNMYLRKPANHVRGQEFYALPVGPEYDHCRCENLKYKPTG